MTILASKPSNDERYFKVMEFEKFHYLVMNFFIIENKQRQDIQERTV